MDEQSFRDLLRSKPGNRTILRQYAKWLIDCGDPRGPHLSAELAVYRGEDALENARAELTRHRSEQTQHFDWLNDVFPLQTFAPVSGTIYRCMPPGDPPLVDVGALVAPDTKIAIIESSNLFYGIAAGHGGLVTDVLFDDCACIDVGDCLLHIIRPQRDQIPPQGR